MQMSGIVSMVAIAAVVCLSHSATALYFYVPVGKKECFSEEVLVYHHENPIRINIFYNVLRKSPTTHLVLTVEKVKLKTVKETLSYTLKSDSDLITIYAEEKMMYYICVAGEDGPVGDSAKMELSITTMEERDDGKAKLLSGSSARLPGKVSDESYNYLIDNLDTHVKTIGENLKSFVSSQTDFDYTVESTYFRVVGFTLLNGFIMLLVGALQIIHMKRFFKTKRVV
eukprot:Tbor_TRINITY_DN1201_c0_g1::TRINITY_DN1201_c0_g1_i1::g.5740::m.5740